MRLKENDELLNKYAVQYLSQAQKHQKLPDYELMTAYAHFYLKEYEKALTYLPNPDMFQNTTDSDYGKISLKAVCYVSLGMTDEALKIIEYLESIDNPFDYGRKYYYKAHIEAAWVFKIKL